ncbi:MAG: oligosaccharide flippase family protein, partial [Actinomycetia bacterium]|nr:oligosaccharide flippase family protein [Actinomycetes bacterium]
MNVGDANGPAPGQSLRSAARGSVLNLLGMAVAAVATFTLAVTLTRVSTPASAGVFFSATSLFLLATSLGRLGTNTGLVYFISGARGRGELGLARRHLRLAATPVFIVAALMSVTFFIGADQLAEWLSAEQPEAFAKNLQIMAVLVPVAAAAQLLSAASQGLGTMKMYSVLEQMLLPVAQLVLVGALLALGHPTVTAAGWTAAFVPVAALAWFWWQRLVGRVDDVGRGASPTRPVAGREFWKFTAPRALAGVSQIAMQRLDIILVGALASLSAAAVYAALTRFLVLGQMAGRAFSLSVQPLLAAALARRDLEDARSLYQSCTAWLVLGTWP